MWPLLRTWTMAVGYHLPDSSERRAWHQSCDQLDLVGPSFAERIQALDAYLDVIDEALETWGRVQLAQRSVKDQAVERSLQELEGLAEQTVQNLRRLTRALRPIYLEDLGLVTALDMLAQETSQNSDLTVNFAKSGQERRLAREVELSLYRIAQEALTNVVKPANATQADLQINFEEQEITLP